MMCANRLSQIILPIFLLLYLLDYLLCRSHHSAFEFGAAEHLRSASLGQFERMGNGVSGSGASFPSRSMKRGDLADSGPILSGLPLPPRPKYRLQQPYLEQHHSAPPGMIESLGGSDACMKPATSHGSGPPPPARPTASQQSRGSDHMMVDPDKPDEGWMVRNSSNCCQLLNK